MRLDARGEGPAPAPDRQALLRTIEALEGQRSTLGDGAVDLAIAPLRARLGQVAGTGTGSEDRTAERKVVTVLFVDVAGFTGMSERIGSEATLDMVNSLFEYLVPVVERYGGIVDKFIGDEIMAVFGAPRSVERHAEHALRAALAMFDALQDYNHSRGVALALHAGVSTGEVIAGAVGSSGRRDYSVTGDAVNVAARLEGAAQGGEIVAGPSTYRQTSHLFDFEALEPLSLKGKSHPLTAYRLIGVASRPTRRRAQGLQLPFSGREAELDVLLGLARNDTATARGVAFVRADAGLGKSRLVSEVHDRLVGQARWFEASGQDYRSDLSYGVVAALLDDIVGVAHGTNRDLVARAYDDYVSAIEGERAREVSPYLLRLRGLPLDAKHEVELSALGADAIRQRIGAAVKDLLVAVTVGQPTVVCIEDLHWADPSSVGLVRSLAEDRAVGNVLFMLTTRHESSAANAWIDTVAAQDGRRIVDLAPLTDRDSRALLDHAFAKGSSAKLADEIGMKSQGNPLYLASFLRSLIDSGLATLTDGRVAVDAPLAALAIPDTLQAVVGAQIDRLPARAKQVLHWAAILGNTLAACDVAQIARVEGLGHHVDAMLSLLKDRQLLETDADDRLRFVHALVRDVAYDQLLERERRRLHGTAARIIEQRIAGVSEPSEADVALLAWHLERAGDRARASLRYGQAAMLAATSHAHPEELLYLDSAIRLADQADRARFAALRERSGDALQLLGRYADAAERYESLMTCTDASAAIDNARLHRKVARTWTPRFAGEQANREIDEARRWLSAANAPKDDTWWREYFAVELFAIWALYMQGRTDACAAIADAIGTDIETKATIKERGWFHRNVALCRLRQQRYRPDAQTLELAKLAVREDTESGDTNELCLTLLGVPFTLLWKGDIEEAEHALHTVLQETVRLGDAERNLLCLVYLAVVYRQLDNVDSAEAFANAAIARANANRSPHYEAVSNGTLAWVAWRRGDGELADRLVDLSLRTTIPQYPFAWISAAVGLARALERSDFEGAVLMVARMLDPSHQGLDADAQTVFERAVAEPGTDTWQAVVDTCRRVRYL